MAFMGIFMLGVIGVVLLVIVGVYLLIALTLLIIGVIGLIRDHIREKQYNEWALAQPAPAALYKRRKSPRVVMWISAVMWGLFAALIAYILISTSVSRKEYEDSRNLYSCVMSHDLEAAQKLIDEGASPDGAGNTDTDPHAAAEDGEETALFTLCNMEQRREDERMIEEITFLLDNGADIEWRVYYHEKDYAEHHGEKNPYGFHTPDGCGRTPLMAAASSGRVETLKLLIARGADINAVDFNGRNALMYAATSFKGERSADIARLLIYEGIDCYARDNFGQNVWDYVEWADMEPVRRVLREEAPRSEYDIEPVK